MSEKKTQRFTFVKNKLQQAKTFLTEHELLFVFVLLFVVAFLAYGIHLRELGLFWDDWGVFWLEQNRGPDGVIKGHMIDRPLIGYNHALLSSLFGQNIAAFHYYAFFLRLFGAYLVLWLLRLLWPDKRFSTTMMTVLFLVYPGFLSQPIAYTKTNHLSALLLVLISLVLTVLALKNDKKQLKLIYWLISLITGGAYYFYFEYLLGFEVVRFGLIAILTWGASEVRLWKKAAQTILRWAPFFLMLCAYFYWRVFVFESGRPTVSVDSLLLSYLRGDNLPHHYLALFFNLIIDYLELIVLTWFVPAYHYSTSSVLSSLGIAILVGGISAGLVMFYYRVFDNGRHESEGKNKEIKKGFQWLIIGFSVLVVTNFLPVVAGRDFALLSVFKSYGLHIAVSASILLVGLLHLIIRPRYRGIVIASLVFLAVVTHNLNFTRMVNYWQVQKDLWWQLSWRAPDLKDWTVLWVHLPDELGINFEQDYETWGPADMIYADEINTETTKIPWIQGEVFYDGTLSLLQQGDSSLDEFRMVSFTKDYGNSLVMSIPSSISCLQVYDNNKLEFSEYTNPLVQVGATYSLIDRVITDGPGHVPPESIFGPEPEHRWCYYYQKASLARQAGDWDEVIYLLEQANQNGYRANDRVEWIPFFEAYVNLDRVQEARKLATIIKSNQGVASLICDNFTDTPGYPGVYDYQTINQLLCQKAVEE
jgi:hypothetical protein